MNTAEVGLYSYGIRMPEGLPAGPTKIHISNGYSTVEHSFRIEGNDVEAELDAPIPPGGEAKLEV